MTDVGGGVRTASTRVLSGVILFELEFLAYVEDRSPISFLSLIGVREGVELFSGNGGSDRPPLSFCLVRFVDVVAILLFAPLVFCSNLFREYVGVVFIGDN